MATALVLCFTGAQTAASTYLVDVPFPRQQLTLRAGPADYSQSDLTQAPRRQQLAPASGQSPTAPAAPTPLAPTAQTPVSLTPEEKKHAKGEAEDFAKRIRELDIRLGLHPGRHPIPPHRQAPRPAAIGLPTTLQPLPSGVVVASLVALRMPSALSQGPQTPHPRPAAAPAAQQRPQVLDDLEALRGVEARTGLYPKQILGFIHLLGEPLAQRSYAVHAGGAHPGQSPYIAGRGKALSAQQSFAMTRLQELVGRGVLHPRQPLQSILSELSALAEKVHLVHLSTFLNVQSYLKHIRKNHEELVERLEVIGQRDEAALAELACRRALYPRLALPEQLELRKEEVAQLRRLTEDSVLPKRLRQLVAFTHYAESQKKEAFLLELAKLAGHSEAAVGALIFPRLRPSPAGQSNYDDLVAALDPVFVEALKSFADQLAMTPEGLMELAQLVSHLKLRSSEQLSKEQQERELGAQNSLRALGFQRAVSGFYPKGHTPLSRWPKGNQVLLSPKVFVFSANEEGMHYDYYFIQLAANVSPDMSRDWTLLAAMPVVLSSCTIRAYPITLTGGQWHPVQNSRLLELCNNWSPIATVGATSLTTTTGMTVQGQFTQSGMEPGGSASVSLSLEHSTARDVQDIEVFPNMRATCPEWRFVFPNLHAKEDRGNCQSRSSAIVTGQWIWRVPKDQARIGLYTTSPAVQLGEEAIPYVEAGGRRFFNVAFGVDVGFKKIVTVPLVEKTIGTREHLVRPIDGVNDGFIASIVEPPKLPAGRTTQVTLLQTQKSDAIKDADGKGGKKKGK